MSLQQTTPKKSIYVVDDSIAYRVFLESILKMNGYSVAGFEEPKDALEHIEKDLPHLVLSDIEMPKMDGFKFYLEVKMNPVISHIPFLFISSTECEHIRKTAEALTNQYPIEKRTSYKYIIERVENFLGFRSLRSPKIHLA